jgi:hypothetical protein
MENYGEENIIAYCHARSRHSIAARMSNYSPRFQNSRRHKFQLTRVNTYYTYKHTQLSGS